MTKPILKPNKGYVRAKARAIKALRAIPIDWESLADDYNSLPEHLQKDFMEQCDRTYRMICEEREKQRITLI